ncbi:MAG: sterol desaturase family protein [Flavobacteriales bacterium]|nr:sterol desaturase family protein [Flavobacteriales bacterium]
MDINYIVFAIPVFFITIGIELWVGYRRKQQYYNFEDAITNLNIGIGSQAIGLLGKILILASYEYVYHHFSFFQLPKDNPLVWIGALIFFDFLYYWAHRWGHEWNWMWGAHIVHHQSQEYNLSVALRQSWFHNFIAFWIFLPLPIFGVHPYVFVGVAGFVTLYQYWIHTKAIKKLPRIIEFIFNTPSHHRVHHAINPQYLDKNYAATFIFWDRMFGTFMEEKEEPVYGITTPFNSWDPVWANFHFYVEMIRGSKKLKTLWQKLGLIFRGPQYLGEVLGQVSKDPEYYKHVPKYQTSVSLNMKLYVLVQFVVLTAGIVKYLIHFDELSLFYQWTCLGLIILTASSCSGIMENKPWVGYIEVMRIMGAIILLNTLYYFNYKDWFMAMLIGSIILGLFFMGWFVYKWMIARDPISSEQSAKV